MAANKTKADVTSERESRPLDMRLVCACHRLKVTQIQSDEPRNPGLARGHKMQVVVQRFRRSSGEDQFSLRGEAQAVGPFVVFDHDFLGLTEQILAAEVRRKGGAAMRGPLG